MSNIEVQGTDTDGQLPASVPITGTGTLPGGAPIVNTTPEGIRNSGLQLNSTEYELQIQWVDKKGNVLTSPDVVKATASAEGIVNAAQGNTNILKETTILPNGQMAAIVDNERDLFNHKINGVDAAYTIVGSRKVGETEWHAGATGIQGTTSTDYLPSNNGVVDGANYAVEGGGLRAGSMPLIRSSVLATIDGQPNAQLGNQLHVKANGTQLEASDPEGLLAAQRDKKDVVLRTQSARVYTEQEVSKETRQLEDHFKETRHFEGDFSTRQRQEAKKVTDVPTTLIPNTLTRDRDTGEVRQAGNAVIETDGGNITAAGAVPVTKLTDPVTVKVGGMVYANPGNISHPALGQAMGGFAVTGSVTTPETRQNPETGVTEDRPAVVGLRGSIGGAVVPTSKDTNYHYHVAGTEATPITRLTDQERTSTVDVTKEVTTNSETPGQRVILSNNGQTLSDTFQQTGATSSQSTTAEIARSEAAKGAWETTKTTDQRGQTTRTIDSVTPAGQDSSLNVNLIGTYDVGAFVSNRHTAGTANNPTITYDATLIGGRGTFGALNSAEAYTGGAVDFNINPNARVTGFVDHSWTTGETRGGVKGAVGGGNPEPKTPEQIAADVNAAVAGVKNRGIQTADVTEPTSTGALSVGSKVEAKGAVPPR